VHLRDRHPAAPLTDVPQKLLVQEAPLQRRRAPQEHELLPRTGQHDVEPAVHQAPIGEAHRGVEPAQLLRPVHSERDEHDLALTALEAFDRIHRQRPLERRR
jgi:hypothetical protein